MTKYLTVGGKNFLAIGDSGVEFDLTKHNMTLIRGLNGVGKSTIIDLLCFLLYGKPFRKITKPLLVNSVNRKNTLVWGTFEANGNRYKIIRGIKPNKFEIYKNDVLIEQDSKSIDYQDELEKIIGCNYKTFTQVDILGSAKYKPFMELSTPDRRAVVEDLLDLSSVSVMAKIAKSERDELSNEIITIKSEISSLEDQISFVVSQEKVIETENSGKIAEYTQEVTNAQSAVSLADEQLVQLSDKIAVIRKNVQRDLTEANRIHDVWQDKLVTAQIEVEHLDNELNFFETTDQCPKCHTKLTAKTKTSTIAILAAQKQTFTESKTKAEDKLEVIRNAKAKINETAQELSVLLDQEHDLSKQRSAYNQTISFYQKQITELSKPTSVQKVNLTQKKALNKSLKDNNDKLVEVTRSYEDVLAGSSMLKDDGFKATIINEYIPLFNRLINEYLGKMNFFCYFMLDSEFNEAIKSRYRDEFIYESFSEGQKMRINLAILFAWRDVTKIRNSVSSNLLIMDEVMDSSMDGPGTEDFFKILKVLDLTNVFIISHAPEAIEGFEHVINVTEENGFSKYEFA